MAAQALTAVAGVVAAVLAATYLLPQNKGGSTQIPASTETYSFVRGAGLGLEDASKLEVDIASLMQQFDILGNFSDDPSPAVTRIVYSKNDLKAREYVKSLMAAAGLAVREDPIGNIFGQWEGTEPEEARVLSGSHADAIPLAGKFDGVLGVLGPVAAVEALRKIGFKPKRSIEVLMFTSEEPTRFAYGCFGSRLMANQEGFKQKLLRAKDKDGLTFQEAAAAAGYTAVTDPGSLADVVIPLGRYSAFVELHIEQAKILETEGIPIGVVSAIAAPAALSVDFSGAGGHAGGQLMPYRNDAGLAAAELALAVERAALSTRSIDTVATSGHLKLEPNAINSVPRKAHIEIDVRDIDGARRDAVVSSIRNSAEAISKQRKVNLDRFEIVNADPPALCSGKVMSAVEQAANELHLPHRRLVSRAYHDSLFMARIAPTGMIFIPCFKGYSHRPDEFASAEDIEHGVKVLALTLAKLSLS